MTGRLAALASLLLAFAPGFAAQTPAQKAIVELAAVRGGTAEARALEEEAAFVALDAARAAQERYAMLEAELQFQIVREESLIQRDRRYVAEGKPGALVRKLAAERERAAAYNRMRRGRWGWRRYPHALHLRRAELMAIDEVEADLYIRDKRRRAICNRVLRLAAQMEREAALAKLGARPVKK
jgi:hypothetical protein